MMKKQYAQIIILAILLLSLVGSIMRCQQRGDAPSKEIIEAPDSDADGQRIPKAFTNFDDYIQFIANNPQYPKNHFSYDSGGKPCYINANPLPNGDGVLE